MIFSIFEFFLIALSQFIILRLVAVNLGVVEIGVWSVLVSSIQMSKLLDPGAVSGSLKFIALAAKREDKRAVEDYVSASVFMVAVFYGVILSFFYFFMDVFFETFFAQTELVNYLHLIPFICISFYVQNIALCFVSCLNNIGHGSYKSIVNVSGMSIQLVCSIYLIKDYGLMGLAVSQFVNYLFVFLFSLTFLLFSFKFKIYRFFFFKISLIKSMIGIGIYVQATSLFWTLFEFSLKLIMARFGGLEMTGFYEVAYRFAAQVRILSAYILSPITPTFIQKYEEGSLVFNRYYAKVYSHITFLGLLGLVSVFLISPLLSIFMFSEVNSNFILFIFLCCIGTFIHILAMTSERSSISFGRAKYNSIGVFMILMGALFISAPLGSILGAKGVATGILLAILIGGLLTLYLNSKRVLHVSLRPNISTFLQTLYQVYKTRKI